MTVTAQLQLECTGHSGPIYTICNGVEPFSLFSAGSDRVVACWDTRTGKQSGLTIKTDAPVFSLCTITHLNLLLVGLNTGAIHVIDIKNRKEIRNLRFHAASVFDMVYDENKHYVYSCDAHGNLVVTDATDFTLVATFPFGNMRIRNLFLQNETLALACGDGSVLLLETNHFNQVSKWQAHELGCNAIVFNRYGTLFSGGKDAWLKKWDDTQLVQGWPAHTGGIYHLLLTHNEELLISASRDKTIKCWNPHTLDPLLRIERKSHKGHQHSVNKLAWDSANGLVWSAGDDRRILAWDLRIS